MSMRPALLCLAMAAPALIASGCERRPAEPKPAPPPVVANTPPRPPVVEPAVLDRSALLTALDQAASTFAATRKPPQEDLTGRRFAIREMFGCLGPGGASATGLAQWAWGPDRRTISVTLTPADWAADPPFNTGGSGWEAVEGVWISRPWMRQDGCPAAAPSVPNLTPAPPMPVSAAKPNAAAPPPHAAKDASPLSPVRSEAPVAGLAAVFAEGGSRLGRRNGAAYAFTLRAESDELLAPPANGFRLILEGRLVAFPGGGAIRCRGTSSDARPTCFVAAELDRVAFEDAGGKLLREWRPN